jgi:hypothetical protein
MPFELGVFGASVDRAFPEVGPVDLVGGAES